MDENIISISQFSNYIKKIFEAEVLLQNICVYGEVGSYNISNGIAYFTLKDENALLNCVMFNPKEKPNIGDVVIVKGSPNYYIKGGKFSFNVFAMMPYGKGLLYENFLKLKSKLEDKGYFDLSIKKALPERVKRIGVVSSSTGAVIQDIIDITRRRNNSVDIVLFPVKVQGIGAELEIANGINFFSDYDKVDVVIVARGGGSMEDLQPFNTEIVADAVYKCKKPLVSAVGHETDFTIIDFCSDLRAPTPSAAAELVVREKKIDIELIDDLMYNIDYLINKKINNIKTNLENITTNINRELINILNIDYLKTEKLADSLSVSINKLLTNKENQLNLHSNLIEKLNPKVTLNKGYVKVTSSGKNVTKVSDLKLADRISFELLDGCVEAEVVDIEERNDV